MTESTKVEEENAARPVPGVHARDRTGKRAGPCGPKVQGGSSEARRQAAAVLDVLAGMRTPTQAAQALGCSLAGYYSREVRALEGLVEACEPRTRKRGASPRKQAVLLEAKVTKLERELARQQALVRASRRAVGLSLPQPKAGEKGKRRRRPVVRALAAARMLTSPPAGTESLAGGDAQGAGEPRP